MATETKLTKAQQDVLEKMKDGAELRYHLGVTTTRYWLFKDGAIIKNVHTRIGNALRDARVIGEDREHEFKGYHKAVYLPIEVIVARNNAKRAALAIDTPPVAESVPVAPTASEVAELWNGVLESADKVVNERNQLRAQVAALTAALEPFAEFVERYHLTAFYSSEETFTVGHAKSGGENIRLKYGDLFNAADALKPKS